jgi:hypothetical protein
MARTTADLVKGVLLDDYGKQANGSLPDLTPYIDSASALVDQVNSDAADKGFSLTSTQLELIERWLSAHFYTKADPVLASKNQGKASGTFVRSQKEPEPYKDVAIQMDISGALNALLNRQTARTVWLGKPVSAQIPYDQRD